LKYILLSLIVNADDFGLTEKVNEGIQTSFRDGILRSTSLMANGKSFDHAVGIIGSNPGLDIGIHLTLVGEIPVLQIDKIPSLLGEDGNFHKNAIDFTKKYFSNNISLEEIRNELTAQFEKILDHGIKISHIDSHQHLHMLPKILDITIELANHYNIKFIRFPREKFSGYLFRDFKSIHRIAQMAVLNHFCSKAKEKISYKTDYFTGFYFGGKLSKKNLLTLIKYLPKNGICELMCHPGLTDNSTTNFHWKYRHVEEMFALVDKELLEVVLKRNIEITSFKNLSH
jgi:chitin disaccharide deacetylase